MTINRVKSNSDASGILDMLRFVAALSVLLLHTTANPYMPGHQAVIVFFVLSGNFVGTSVLANMQNCRWSWREYLVNRLTRLWIVLLPALVLTAFWDVLKAGIFGTDSVAGYHLDAGTFLANVFFLQGVNIPVFGNNGPLWSLSYEFWYYMLFPFIALACLSEGTTKRLIYTTVTLLLGLFVYKVLGLRVLVYFPIWLIGVLPALLRPMELQGHAKVWANTFVWLFTIASLWWPYFILNEHPNDQSIFSTLWGDLIVGLSMSLLILTVVSSLNRKRKIPTRFTTGASYLAGFSYTLYLVHYPVLGFAHEYISAPDSVYQNGHYILKVIFKVGTLIGFIVYAWLVSRCSEAHTNKIRRIFKEQSDKIASTL